MSSSDTQPNSKEIDEKLVTFDQLSDKDKLLWRELEYYFKSRPGALELLTSEVLKSDPLSAMSMRSINHFIVKYTVRHGIHYLIPTTSSSGETERPLGNIGTASIFFTILASYRRLLKDWKKEDFDPYRRQTRILWTLSNGNQIKTTLCQLNFYRWLLEYNVAQCVFRYRKAIKEDIMQTHALDNQKRKRQFQEQLAEDDEKDEEEGDGKKRKRKHKANAIPAMTCVPVPTTIVTWAFNDEKGENDETTQK